MTPMTIEETFKESSLLALRSAERKKGMKLRDRKYIMFN